MHSHFRPVEHVSGRNDTERVRSILQSNSPVAEKVFRPGALALTSLEVPKIDARCADVGNQPTPRDKAPTLPVTTSSSTHDTTSTYETQADSNRRLLDAMRKPSNNAWRPTHSTRSDSHRSSGPSPARLLRPVECERR